MGTAAWASNLTYIYLHVCMLRAPVDIVWLPSDRGECKRESESESDAFYGWVTYSSYRNSQAGSVEC